MLQEEISGLQPSSNGLQPSSNGLQPDNFWREYCKQIPQPCKKTGGGFKRIKGADGNDINNSGPVLTEDLIVGYFDSVDSVRGGESQDVLHVVLIYIEEENVWVLPGKRDRAYDLENADISIKDANYSLVEKEIGMSRSNAVINNIIAIFDDRKREERMKTTSVISFVLLDKKPTLINGKRIGLPINALIGLINGEISIPTENGNSIILGRNHDSLLSCAIQTATFYSLMEKIKQNQVKIRQLSLTKYPEYSSIDCICECNICNDILIDATSICEEGHTICGVCFKGISNLGSCPECRKSLKPRKNRIVDDMVKQRYPEEYYDRASKIGLQITTWKNDPYFNGKFIQFS